MPNAGWGFFANRRRLPGHATVSLSSDRIAIVAKAAGRSEAVAFERLAPGDPGAALAALVRECGAEGMACEWVLEPGSYTLMQVDKPPVPAAEWVQALRWKVRDLIAFPVEEAVMDAFEVPGLESRGRPSTLYLAVARKDELRPKIAQIASAGLHLDRIGIADLAWAEAAQVLAPGGESQVVLVVDGRGGTMLALREDTLFVARRFEFDAEEQRVLCDAQPGAGDRLFERVALELQRTLDYFDRTHQRPPPRRLLLLCGVDGLAGLGEALRNLLGLEVSTGECDKAFPALAALPVAARVRLAGLAARLAVAGRA